MQSIIDHDGKERWLGNNIPTKALSGDWVVYGDTPSTPMISRSKWAEICAKVGSTPDMPYLTKTHDQDGIGMCNCSATAGATETARLRQGLKYISLSGGDLYRRISGGRDNGSMLEDGLSEALKNGICSTEAVPYLDWHNPSSSPDNTSYKVLEAFVCPTFDHCFSAVCEGFDLISGVMWFNNYKPGDDGWLPMHGAGGGGGHAVHGYKPAMKGSDFGIWHQNSWTAQWGPFGGCCVFNENMYGGSVGGWWAIRSVTMESGDTPTPRWK